MITSIRSDEKVEELLKSIYDNYINYVKKNYLFTIGSIIDIKVFKDEVNRICKNLWVFFKMEISVKRNEDIFSQQTNRWIGIRIK